MFVTILSGLTIGFFANAIAQGRLERALENEVRLAAQSSLRLVDRRIRRWQQDLDYLVTEFAFSTRSVDALFLSRQLSEFRNRSQAFVQLSFYSLDGEKLADSDALNLSDRLRWPRPRNLPSRGSLLRVQESDLAPGRFLEMAAMVRSQEGEELGLVVGRVSLSRLEEDINASEFFSVSELDFDAFLLSEEGRLLCSSTREPMDPEKDYAEFRVEEPSVIRNHDVGLRVLLPGAVGEGGALGPWIVSVGSDEASIDQVLVGMEKRIFYSVMGAIILLLPLVFWLSSVSFRPISKLLQAIHKLGEGAGELPDFEATGEMQALGVALKSAAEKRMQYEKKLKRANDDLNAFVYIVSHDLRAPLRAIDMIADWIREDCPNELSETGNEHLTTLKGRVARMKKYLDDLLEYSRIGRADHPWEEFDLAALIEDAIQLAGVPPSFTVLVDNEVQRISTHRAPLLNVLLNLISNAAKHHDRERGEIKVICRENTGRLRVDVRDDGPGIPAEFHSKIFRIFTTLQPRDKVEGSGMGLAFVKKTVENFDGKVWVESGEQRGACFSFSWSLARSVTSDN